MSHPCEAASCHSKGPESLSIRASVRFQAGEPRRALTELPPIPHVQEMGGGSW